MRSALVTLGHPQHAGMLRSLRVLDDASAAHGWRLHFVVPVDHPLIDASGLPRDRVTILPGLGRWRRWRSRATAPYVIARLARLARNVDVLYSQTLATFPYARWAGRLTRRPQVVHVYSSYGEARSYRKLQLGQARHVIAPSADSLRLAAEAIGSFGPSVTTHVIYNGMDVDRLQREAALPPPPIPVGVPLIGMVGNLDWRKNPETLVEATPRIRAAIPDVRVLLVGAFPDDVTARRVRERVAALGLGDTVVEVGFLENPFPVVSRLDVLVHPALRDPFPLALLEGMALTRPIVASAVGGVPEMLVDGTSGSLVPPRDAPALADAVIALLQSPARRRAMGEAARTRLVDTFSLGQFATRMFAAFDAAVDAQVA